VGFDWRYARIPAIVYGLKTPEFIVIGGTTPNPLGEAQTSGNLLPQASTWLAKLRAYLRNNRLCKA